MNRLSRSALKFFVVAALCGSSAAALAMPKAAEHEDAPVTSGADAARPKRSAVAVKPPTTANAKPSGSAKAKPAGAAAKTHAAGKTAKSGKTVKAGNKTAKPGADRTKGKAAKSAKTAKHANHPATHSAARPAKMAKTTHR